MNNFDYYGPTRIVFGKDTIGRLPELLRADTRILLLYGGGSVLDAAKFIAAARYWTEGEPRRRTWFGTAPLQARIAPPLRAGSPARQFAVF